MSGFHILLQCPAHTTVGTAGHTAVTAEHRQISAFPVILNLIAGLRLRKAEVQRNNTFPAVRAMAVHTCQRTVFAPITFGRVYRDPFHNPPPSLNVQSFSSLQNDRFHLIGSLDRIDLHEYLPAGNLF